MNKIDVYVINLKKREDRLTYIIDHLKKINFININIFEAIEHEVGSIGCTLSHLSLINYANKNKLPYIIVIEDDFNLELDINEFEILLKNIITFTDIDIFNGVPSWSNILKKYKYTTRDDFYLTKGVLSSAFMIYFNKSYSKFYNIDFFKDPIDLINNIYFYQLIYHKQIGYQIPSHSSVSNTFSDHIPHFKFVYDIIQLLPSNELEDINDVDIDINKITSNNIYLDKLNININQV